MEILVFATSVKRPKQIGMVKKLLTNIPAVAQWNFDLEDCDNILRIVANGLSPRYIELLLQNEGIHCQELPY